CRLCQECLGTCPLGVDIPTVNRSLMYADGYNDYGLAQETYARLPLHVSAAACTNCETCTAQCVKGLNIPANMARAKTLFA
ncbi:MAG: 4Fe-4S dicluster domain-containing protein, partial [Candidatus Hydrogenedentes bacterium]|nr:4Fe-4S dicluster domain-containing protein [Candidatus Hydrogenedentota bacterium]